MLERRNVSRTAGGVAILTCKSFVMLGERAMDKLNHLTAGYLQRFPQDNWSPTTSSGKANGWRTREQEVLVPFSNLNMGKIQWLVSLNLWGT